MKNIKFLTKRGSKGFLSVTPVSEPDGQTGGLLVHVERGTNLRDRPFAYYGIPITYREVDVPIKRT